MKKLSWNKQSFLVDGKPAPLISGEFHYFRVPKKDWRERLILLKESGANAAATYIPWIVHEPREGEILFDDVDGRCLTEFLELCCELDIMVIARPGPYSYSELWNSGMPFWLAKYKEIRSCNYKGDFREDSFEPSYLHPLFLEKARKYIRAVDEKIKPFLVTNGGCIVSVQADNEIGGIHIWRGFLDCNKEGMGIGFAGGRYVNFLERKYGTVDALNERYETSYASFCDVDPYNNTPSDKTVGGKRFAGDYHAFYKETLETYIRTICAWFREDGIDVDVCVNAGTPALIPIMRDIPSQNTDFKLFMGVDHYYSLTPAAGISMTPEKTMKYLNSLDMLASIGMPPSVLEMQSGSASCYPPILPNNLKGFYMTHVAYGMKGSNYYVFTGGPNFENTGCNTDIYDYHAPVSAEGEIRPIYYAQKERNCYTIDNSWLLSLERVSDVQLGYTWELAEKIASGPWKRYSGDGLNMRACYDSVLLTLGLGGAMPKCVELCDDLDVSKPLVVVTDGMMPKEKQERLVEFVRSGGQLLLTPTVPEYDEDFLPCTVLRDFLGIEKVGAVKTVDNVTRDNGVKVYGAEQKFSFEGFNGQVLVRDDGDGTPIVEYKKLGSGTVALMGMSYRYSQFCQMDLLFDLLEMLGFKRRAVTGSRNLMVSLFEDGERATCFLINNLADTVEADLTVTANGKTTSVGRVTVPSMSVLDISL